jgi:hypothetical protein
MVQEYAKEVAEDWRKLTSNNQRKIGQFSQDVNLFLVNSVASQVM